MNQGALHLLAYDVADRRRLSRVAAIAESHGVRVQYSLFVMRLTPAARKALVAELSRVIDPREDDVRIYPLPARPAWELYGRAMWPEGISLSGLWPAHGDEDGASDGEGEREP